MDTVVFPNQYNQQFEALQNQILSLEARVKKLEGELMAMKARMGKQNS